MTYISRPESHTEQMKEKYFEIRGIIRHEHDPVQDIFLLISQLIQ
jgi:hypothetical protein